MTIMIDTSEAGEVEFELLPPGWYEVVVYEAKLKKKENGNQQIEFQFKVRSPGEFENRRVWFTNALDARDKNFFVKKTLTALGFIVNGVFELDFDELGGKKANVRIEHREYPPNSGKLRQNVGDIRPIDETESVPHVAYDEELGEDVPPHGDDDAINF